MSNNIIFSAITLEELGLKAGDIISASVEIKGEVGQSRRGRIAVFFRNSVGTNLLTPARGWLPNTGDWQVAKLEGFAVPASECQRLLSNSEELRLRNIH